MLNTNIFILVGNYFSYATFILDTWFNCKPVCDPKTGLWNVEMWILNLDIISQFVEFLAMWCGFNLPVWNDRQGVNAEIFRWKWKLWNGIRVLNDTRVLKYSFISDIFPALFCQHIIAIVYLLIRNNWFALKQIGEKKNFKENIDHAACWAFYVWLLYRFFLVTIILTYLFLIYILHYYQSYHFFLLLQKQT